MKPKHSNNYRPVFVLSFSPHSRQPNVFVPPPSLFLSVSLDLWWVNFHLAPAWRFYPTADMIRDILDCLYFIGSKPDNYGHSCYSSKAPAEGCYQSWRICFKCVIELSQPLRAGAVPEVFISDLKLQISPRPATGWEYWASLKWANLEWISISSVPARSRSDWGREYINWDYYYCLSQVQINISLQDCGLWSGASRKTWESWPLIKWP